MPHSPQTSKCYREACTNQHNCWKHTQLDTYYCSSCARKINEANPEVPNLIRPPKTRPHNTTEYHKTAIARSKEAETIAPQFSIKWFAENAILKLRDTADNGYVDCYHNYNDFMTDFWPDLPWTATEAIAVIGHILTDPRMPAISETIKTEYGFDMLPALEDARTEWQEILKYETAEQKAKKDQKKWPKK